MRMADGGWICAAESQCVLNGRWVDGTFVPYASRVVCIDFNADSSIIIMPYIILHRTWRRKRKLN